MNYRLPVSPHKFRMHKQEEFQDINISLKNTKEGTNKDYFQLAKQNKKINPNFISHIPFGTDFDLPKL